MKKLIMFLLVHISPNAIFSQVADTTALLRQFDASKWGHATSTSEGPMFLRTGSLEGRLSMPAPDTLRAILLITLGYRQMGIAHARMGYVVIEPGKPVVYLDCRKKALKWPMVGWDWREVDLNYKSR